MGQTGLRNFTSFVHNSFKLLSRFKPKCLLITLVTLLVKPLTQFLILEIFFSILELFKGGERIWHSFANVAVKGCEKLSRVYCEKCVLMIGKGLQN